MSIDKTWAAFTFIRILLRIKQFSQLYLNFCLMLHTIKHLSFSNVVSFVNSKQVTPGVPVCFKHQLFSFLIQRHCLFQITSSVSSYFLQSNHEMRSPAALAAWRSKGCVGENLPWKKQALFTWVTAIMQNNKRRS